MVSGCWHVRLTCVEGGSFLTKLSFALGGGVCGCVSNVASMHPSLIEVTKDDNDDASDNSFAIIIVTLGIGVGFLLVEPFDCESPKEELNPPKARLESDKVVEMFGEISFVDVGGGGRL